VALVRVLARLSRETTACDPLIQPIEGIIFHFQSRLKHMMLSIEKSTM
jgi:hypothetical protein